MSVKTETNNVVIEVAIPQQRQSPEKISQAALLDPPTPTLPKGHAGFQGWPPEVFEVFASNTSTRKTEPISHPRNRSVPSPSKGYAGFYLWPGDALQKFISSIDANQTPKTQTEIAVVDSRRSSRPWTAARKKVETQRRTRRVPETRGRRAKIAA